METQNGAGAPQSSLKGYRVIIGVLVVVLLGLSAFYYSINKQQQEEYVVLTSDRDAIQADLSELITKYDAAQTDNKELQVNMEIERNRADSIITALKKERSFNYTKIRKYERETSALRSTMRGYLQQIDSLNKLNQKLIGENVSYKKKISEVEERAETAEERAARLNSRIEESARMRAEGITLLPLNKRDRKLSRIRRARSLSVNFTIPTNALTEAGNKKLYACITSPDGYVLTTEEVPTFSYNGKKTTYSAMREVDFQNATLPVSIFFKGEGFVKGKYVVEVYTDNWKMGEATVEMR